MVAAFAGFDIKRVTVPDNIIASLNIPTMEALQRGLTMEILLLGVVFAFVASAETLLCATAVDQMLALHNVHVDLVLVLRSRARHCCGSSS